MAKPKSRPARWALGISEAQSILEELRDAETELETAQEDAEAELETAQEDAKKGAVTKAEEARNAVALRLQDSFSVLEGIREEYEEWQGNLPENLQDGVLADKLGEVVGLSFEWDEEDGADEAESLLSEAEGVDLPRGFGRD